MERALDPALLRAALGTGERLPSAEELASLVSAAEIGLLLNRRNVPDELVGLAWYLHSVGSVLPAFDLYGADRQRAALRVAGHIFDIALQAKDLAPRERLEYVFAAQIAYLRSEIQPNSLAIYRRDARDRMPQIDIVASPAESSLALGSALLALDSDYLFRELRSVRQQLNVLAVGFDGLATTPYATAAAVADAVRNLHVFLVYGSTNRMEPATESLLAAVSAEASEGDRIGKWVAAHLLVFTEGLGGTSIWTALPPDVPFAARRAFAQGSPRVATLWPPQIQVVGTSSSFPNPFSTDVSRLVLSMPTSAGKTLLSQLIIAVHIASGRGGVCYVAPTRSLCREVRASLDRRLRYLDMSVGAEIPDFTEFADLGVQLPSVEVMTPERLSFLLRRDATAVLETYKLFVFDEVHTVADRSRGWVFETLVSFVNNSTQDSDHQILAMSAALGNQNQIAAWLGTGRGDAVSFESAWRGPRRLHCIWTTSPDWSQEVREERRSAQRPLRLKYPVHGVLYARTGASGQRRRLSTTQPIGSLSLAAAADGTARQREVGQSTPFYRMLGPLVEFLATQGPVLVVESTKRLTIDLAASIANERPGLRASPALLELRAFVTARLGASHPLADVVAKGVAYHHGSLPLDVRGAIEDGLRDGVIDVLVATTSLTEGVNLPVRSVVVGSQGRTWGEESERDYISGSRLLNAIGRAGRAAMETEGVVVLARAASFSDTDFDRLDPDPEQLVAQSALASEEALAELAALDDALRQSEDAVFDVAAGIAADFISFVWFLAAELERVREEFGVNDVAAFLQRTLAWQQLDEGGRDLVGAVAASAVRAYRDTAPGPRRRWARSGAPIATARAIDRVAASIAELDIDESDLFGSCGTAAATPRRGTP